ncbi:MAG TPA: hypothetical protein VF011_13825, partial [Terriglobales bacterium]
LYFYRQLQRGAYPMEADSIGLPIMGITMWVIALLVPLNFTWWWLLRRYPGSVPLSSSNNEIAAHTKIIGAIGVIFASVWGVAGVLAAVENAWEITPVFSFGLTSHSPCGLRTSPRDLKPDCPLP